MTKKYPPPHRALYCKNQLKEAGGWGRETWMDIYSYVLVRVCENEASFFLCVHKKFYRTFSMRLNLATYTVLCKVKKAKSCNTDS